MVEQRESPKRSGAVVPAKDHPEDRAKVVRRERAVERPDPPPDPALDRRPAAVLLIDPVLLIVLVRPVQAVHQQAETALGRGAPQVVELAVGEMIGPRVVQQLMTAGLMARHSRPLDPGAELPVEGREPPPVDELSGRLEPGETPSRLRHLSVGQIPPAGPRQDQYPMKQPTRNDGQ